MDASIEVEVRPAYMHIKYPPGFVISPESSEKLWNNIGDLSRKHRRSKVLLEASAPVRELDTMSAFDSGRMIAEIMPVLTVALCFYDYAFDELSAFFKTVAQNRGVTIEMFTDMNEALAWLNVDTGQKTAGTS